MTAFLLGRPPGPSSVVPELARRLGADVVVFDGTVPEADLLVLKDLTCDALVAVERSGARTCDGAAAVRASLDKAAVVARLTDARVPVPASRLLHDWQDVRAVPGPVVVKPQRGVQGDGVLLLDGPAPADPVTDGPWLVQDRVAGDGVDRKLYVVGDRVLGVLRRWPAPTDRAGTPFAPDAGLVAVARAAARAVGLTVCGVDVVVSPDGPVVVDVNAFPGFKGVDGAVAVLVDHLRAQVPVTGVAACA